MGRRQSLSNNYRNRTLGMLQSGVPCRNYVGTLGVAPSTISRLFNPFNATNSVCDSARSGCPRVTTQRQDNLMRTLNWRNRTLNARILPHELRTDAGVSVSDQIIRNCFQETSCRTYPPYSASLEITFGLVLTPSPLDNTSVVHCLLFGRNTIQFKV